MHADGEYEVHPLVAERPTSAREEAAFPRRAVRVVVAMAGLLACIGSALYLQGPRGSAQSSGVVAENLARAVGLADTAKLDEINMMLKKNLDALTAAYDGKDQENTPEVDWASAKKDLEDMKTNQKELVEKAMQGTRDAIDGTVSVLDKCKATTGDACTAGKLANDLIGKIQALTPVLAVVGVTLGPFAPIIGSLGTVLGFLFASDSPAPHPITAVDIQKAAEAALAKYQFHDIMTEWQSFTEYFKTKTAEYTAMGNDIEKQLKTESAEKMNEYIENEFVKKKWSADKAQFEDYVRQIQESYANFAGPGDTSIRHQKVASMPAFQKDCWKTVCRQGAIRAYLPGLLGRDTSDEDVLNECWNPLNEATTNWQEVLKMLNSYLVLSTQMRVWQTSIFSIVSMARAAKDSSGAIQYPVYSRPGNLLSALNLHLQKIFQSQDILNNLLGSIMDKCNYPSYPLGQACASSEDCGYTYAFTSCPGGALPTPLVEMGTDWSFGDFTRDCKAAWEKNHDAHGYASGGMWTNQKSGATQSACGVLKPKYPACNAYSFRLAATPEYCVVNEENPKKGEECRDLMTNPDHWTIPDSV